MPLAKHAEASKMGAEGVGVGGKPGLWSWHLIPTSCRLSEQLQGRTLLLNCNDQFEQDRKPLTGQTGYIYKITNQ